MIRLAVASFLALASAAGAQTAQEVDIGGLLKKPCDEAKQKPEATPTPAPKPAAKAEVEAIPGLIAADK